MSKNLKRNQFSENTFKRWCLSFLFLLLLLFFGLLVLFHRFYGFRFDRVSIDFCPWEKDEMRITHRYKSHTQREGRDKLERQRKNSKFNIQNTQCTSKIPTIRCSRDCRWRKKITRMKTEFLFTTEFMRWKRELLSISFEKNLFSFELNLEMESLWNSSFQEFLCIGYTVKMIITWNMAPLHANLLKKKILFLSKISFNTIIFDFF